jgi:hypothetical protein
MVTSGGKHLHITQPTVLLGPKNDEDLLLCLAFESLFHWKEGKSTSWIFRNPIPLGFP